MAGLLSGLSSLGLGDLENAKIYAEPKSEKSEDNNGIEQPEVKEKDLIYDRSFECPVCDAKLTSKVMKTGKSKFLHADTDLRMVYEGLDVQKYDVITCPKCGFTALNRYFKPMTSVQVKLIKEKICKNVQIKPNTGDIYTYEEAMERYKLALACAIVKQAKASEKAYICLKSAWLLRGWQEELSGLSENENTDTINQLNAQEMEYLSNAMEGFITAMATEAYPICGMDEITFEYLIAVLALQFKKFDVSSKMIASILTSHAANARMKDKARDLKDALLVELKKAKG